MSKLTKKADTSYYFIDGYPARDELVRILALPNALQGTDTEVVTFHMARPDKWARAAERALD
jgi:hypothetical protein